MTSQHSNGRISRRSKGNVVDAAELFKSIRAQNAEEERPQIETEREMALIEAEDAAAREGLDDDPYAWMDATEPDDRAIMDIEPDEADVAHGLGRVSISEFDR